MEAARSTSGPLGRRRRPAAGVQHQKTIKQTNEAAIRLDLEKTQAVRKADRCDLRVL